MAVFSHTKRRRDAQEKDKTMSMTHSTIAQIFTNRLALEEFHDAENSVERGRCAEMEAWSLTRLVMRLVTWGRAPAVPETQIELQAAVKRLSELSQIGRAHV